MNKYTTISEFLDAQDQDKKAQVVLLRQIITAAHPELGERIKWNSPSYTLSDEDRITFSVRPDFPVAIVLHMGATRPEDKAGKPIMDDPSGLIEWKSDTRGVISFADLDDIHTKETHFVDIIDKWLSLPL